MDNEQLGKYERAKLLIACCQLLIDLSNAQVSDTTGDDKSDAAGLKKINQKTYACNFFE